ncbi:related to aspartate aminotransferase [Melanopsichium pennsylvanicum]|uniref:Related to aspartate aminotransferase n=2 Tax=Melanopsichium pennsylvanicum TaxID=63383 RepID=A0AAJ5C5B6_9BASI|nr:aspartate aminotransferase [Melanopsichium pennsylvanicum 4]SNX84403.1 related to aspartate aminotransferase [Melanopsichium pennsylvanicum]
MQSHCESETAGADRPVKKFKAAVNAVISNIDHEDQSEAHQIFRNHPGHGHGGRRGYNLPKEDLEAFKNQLHTRDDKEKFPGISHVGSTGVIYVTDRATSNGFYHGNPEWANLGQGAPEVGNIEGGVPRSLTFDLTEFGEGVHEYAPNTGTIALRKAIANYYNKTFREGKEKKFTHENVCLTPGGRSGMTRLAAVIGPVNCGYQLPEYTSYESMLSAFKSLVPIPTVLSEEDRYKLSTDDLRKEIVGRGLSAMIMSNPRNPTGMMIEGDELKRLVETSKELGCTILLDEFYSWYMHQGPLGRANSAAEYIDDIDETPVVMIDGLTKGWRLPGWRVCWVVGPKDIITALNQSGSFLDGGASHPMQCMALQMLDIDRTKQDRIALQKLFRHKRQHVLTRLKKMGLQVKVEPQATFYIWLSLESLPPPLNSGLVMFEELLREKTICVAGIAFDINPSMRRNIVSSPCEKFIRISYGPSLAEVDRGLDAIERVIAKADPNHADNHTLGKGFVPTKSANNDVKHS